MYTEVKPLGRSHEDDYDTKGVLYHAFAARLSL